MTASAPPCRTPLAVTSKVLMVTVRPPTKPAEPLVLVELSHIINVSVPSPCLGPAWVPPAPLPQGAESRARASSSQLVATSPRLGARGGDVASAGGARQVPQGPKTLLGVGEGQGVKR